ncbi:MAG TPA: deoxyguanosinetriphosphate triphosphohydrolase [Candidatus Hydrogenedentes bacterium]|nr:deoxyguanosinetriphosphate triphosphohydrolase [Candidatus Hydrogenedentota bacterium]
MTVRELLEERERQTLAPYAARACASRGRLRPEHEHEYRTAFQRDRDRIVHSKAFRRLKRKTQVFLAPEDDHYRTRLTHTLEVAQIARTVARALGLNEDLTEAAALGHDLGHTPFGHAGEAVLDEVFEPGFRHYEQSLRVVDELESARGERGLNLTCEVRDAILHHSMGKRLLYGERVESASTLEGEVLSLCDAIAYVSHDIDDALRANVICADELPQETVKTLGKTTAERLNSMVVGLIQGSQEGRIGIMPEVREATCVLRDFLYTRVYTCEVIDAEIGKAKGLLREMYGRLLETPTAESAAGAPEDSLERRTVDFIAGMTDQYALRLYKRLFFPAPWRI